MFFQVRASHVFLWGKNNSVPAPVQNPVNRSSVEQSLVHQVPKTQKPTPPHASRSFLQLKSLTGKLNLLSDPELRNSLDTSHRGLASSLSILGDKSLGPLSTI